MAKKGLDLGGMIDATAAPVDTGIPQRGAEPLRRVKPKPERRSDQMSIRMRPSIRARVEELAEAEGVPIAEVVERALLAYKSSA